MPRHKDGKAELQSGAMTELTVLATLAPYGVAVVQSTNPNGIFDALASRPTRKVLYVHEVEDFEVLRKIYGGFRRFANPSSTNACH